MTVKFLPTDVVEKRKKEVKGWEKIGFLYHQLLGSDHANTNVAEVSVRATARTAGIFVREGYIKFQRVGLRMDSFGGSKPFCLAVSWASELSINSSV